MPSLFSHPAPALACAVALGPRVMPLRLTGAAVIASIAPDLDVAGFFLGVRYAEALGHRGLSHSLACALLIGLVGFLAAPLLKTRRITAFLVLVAMPLSHIALDAMTTGGLGVAFFWPFDEARHFFSWRPIEVSPLNPKKFFTEWGLRVLLSELRYVWLPCVAVAVTGLVARRITHRLAAHGKRYT